MIVFKSRGLKDYQSIYYWIFDESYCGVFIYVWYGSLNTLHLLKITDSSQEFIVVFIVIVIITFIALTLLFCISKAHFTNPADLGPVLTVNGVHIDDLYVPTIS